MECKMSFFKYRVMKRFVFIRGLRVGRSFPVGFQCEGTGNCL